MITVASARRWYLVHKWTSLVCTAFLLLLCITGLPLVFHHEIDALSEKALPSLPAGTSMAPADAIVAKARAARPGEVVQYLLWDADEPARVSVATARDAQATDDVHILAFDGRTATLLQSGGAEDGVMAFILKLHVEMFAGLPGKLFLGLMGLLFVASIVSGVVVYGPFMRKLRFGTVRADRSPRLRWLDVHNLTGIVTVAWVVVVGVTGVINTWADLVIKFWQFDQLAAMTAPYKGQSPLKPSELGSVQAAVETARLAAPGRAPSFVAFPGTMFSSGHHYAVFLRGGTPLTARLLKPALVDARTAELTDSRDLPWYVTSLLVSQPLHFGDYGGLPLKIVWALLDVMTIAVLGSGIYLWLGRRRRPIEQRIAEVMAGGEDEALPAAAAGGAAAAAGAMR